MHYSVCGTTMCTAARTPVAVHQFGQHNTAATTAVLQRSRAKTKAKPTAPPIGAHSRTFSSSFCSKDITITAAVLYIHTTTNTAISNANEMQPTHTTGTNIVVAREEQDTTDADVCEKLRQHKASSEQSTAVLRRTINQESTGHTHTQTHTSPGTHCLGYLQKSSLRTHLSVTAASLFVEMLSTNELCLSPLGPHICQLTRTPWASPAPQPVDDSTHALRPVHLVRSLLLNARHTHTSHAATVGGTQLVIHVLPTSYPRSADLVFWYGGGGYRCTVHQQQTAVSM